MKKNDETNLPARLDDDGGDLPAVHRGRRHRFAPDQVARALTTTHGCIHAAAKALGCSPRTVSRYVRQHIEVKRARDDAIELRIDMAELRLDQAVQAGEPWAIAFLLKTFGRKRGYVQRQEITGADGAPVLDGYPDPSTLTREQLEEIILAEERGRRE